MKKIALFIFVIFLSVTDCHSVEKKVDRELVDGFKVVLGKTNVLIRQIVPPNFVPVAIDHDFPFRYDYALKSEQAGIEIRYTVHSIPAYLKEFEEFKKKNPQATLVPPKKDDYLSHFFVNLQNLAGSPENIYGSKPFPNKAVKDEFGADWGSNSYIKLNPTYDKVYQYCNVVVLHKDNVADIYILYLSSDREKLAAFLRETYLFYNIRFL
ncbi:hypothetical protein EFP84_07370 [Leptospira kmetyi]|uniref:Uncharacterized protein n=1 Tax=Leptospira kmetyi TaxID=408139 RepID=A0AAD0USE4_9LEPT|nr:hypothetical protein [Leptospira kmetyi]AYV55348.1 hypothetical protein EFP84_07370 [Leptospira kmetyi]TGL70552.1 hypothetical protein EHQ67_07150 [Leptospira kmetyi]